MARALKNPIADPTYLDFFGMKQPPFAPLSGPSQIFHSDQYSLLMTHLAGATEQSDCLMVMCGADGSGKTTLLNRYTTSLDQDVSFATFDETCADGNQFYCAFLRQLGFHDISGTLQELRRITREFLIHRGIAGDPVLVIIDNAHLVSPSVFEQLRWIADTKVEDTRVLSIVLAGNSDLPRIMDSPAMRMLKFRRHIDFTIRVYTEEETEDYVRHRLRLAEGADAIVVLEAEADRIHLRMAVGALAFEQWRVSLLLALADEDLRRVVRHHVGRRRRDDLTHQALADVEAAPDRAGAVGSGGGGQRSRHTKDAAAIRVVQRDLAHACSTDGLFDAVQLGEWAVEVGVVAVDEPCDAQVLAHDVFE